MNGRFGTLSFQSCFFNMPLINISSLQHHGASQLDPILALTMPIGSPLDLLGAQIGSSHSIFFIPMWRTKSRARLEDLLNFSLNQKFEVQGDSKFDDLRIKSFKTYGGKSRNILARLAHMVWKHETTDPQAPCWT
jgi:hypothetical protein